MRREGFKVEMVGGGGRMAGTLEAALNSKQESPSEERGTDQSVKEDKGTGR
jgi:hypothetical protein